MTKAQTAAYVFAQSVEALAQIEGMKATNQAHVLQDLPPPYHEENFTCVCTNLGIGSNDICEMYRLAEPD